MSAVTKKVPLTHSYPYLYSNKEKNFVWYCDRNGNRFWTVSGVLGRGWICGETTHVPARKGMTEEESADFEVEQMYKRKKKLGFSEDSEVKIESSFKVQLAGDFILYQKQLKYPVFVQAKIKGARAYWKSGFFDAKGNPVEEFGLEKLLKEIGSFKEILDGVLVYGEDKKIESYVVFDILINENDDSNYSDRLELLNKKINSNFKYIKLTETLKVNSLGMLSQKFRKMGPIIVKNDSSYNSGFSKNCLDFKGEMR